MMSGGRPTTVAILCGGRGTRLQEHSQSIPKPLVEIGGRPILWHVMQIYASQAYRRFVLCTGYRGESIAEFVEGERWPAGVEVRCEETGLDTPTGGRIARVRGLLEDGTCAVTYGDGVADVDLGALADFHAERGRLATMTVVRPELQFGVAELDGENLVRGFTEKPRLDSWINGGFFCLEPGALDYIAADSVFEREPLEGLAADGQLAAYRHAGFWDCMDTYKDAVALNDLWAAGSAPWNTWS